MLRDRLAAYRGVTNSIVYRSTPKCLYTVEDNAVLKREIGYMVLDNTRLQSASAAQTVPFFRMDL
jgi:hypothetical protein